LPVGYVDKEHSQNKKNGCSCEQGDDLTQPGIQSYVRLACYYEVDINGYGRVNDDEAKKNRYGNEQGSFANSQQD